MDFSFTHTPSILLGRPNNSFRFLVFSGFRNLLEHSGRVFRSWFYVCEPVFLSFLVLVFCFIFLFSFLNLNRFSKLNILKKKSNFEQF
jgi:hypothetical protein